EHRPARALDRRRVGGEVVLEGVEGTERVLDRLGDLTLRLAAAVGGEVVPEDRVVDVPAEIEREVLLVQVHSSQVARLTRGGQLVEGRVRAVHVRLVMLVVVELHDLAADVRLERAVVVGKVGQRIHGHVSSCYSGGDDTARRDGPWSGTPHQVQPSRYRSVPTRPESGRTGQRGTSRSSRQPFSPRAKVAMEPPLGGCS